MRCAVGVAPMRAAPGDDAEQVTQLLRGEPVRAEEQRDGWIHVVTAYDYRGWVRASALEGGEGMLPSEGPEPLEAARVFLGAPYEWGGMTPAGIDCSGLVHMGFRVSGRLVPRDSWQQEAAGTPVAPGSELPGDVVVYGKGERADHVAFWLGERRILHATGRDGLGVVEEVEPVELAAQRRGVVRLIPESVATTTKRGIPLKRTSRSADIRHVDAAQREEILTRYREHSRRFQTVAARRNPPVGLIEFPARPAAPEGEHLPTAREIEVLQLVSEGLVNREIGDRLFLSEETVKSHVRHLLAKLQARSRAHAVAVGFRRGLLT